MLRLKEMKKILTSAVNKMLKEVFQGAMNDSERELKFQEQRRASDMLSYRITNKMIFLH